MRQFVEMMCNGEFLNKDPNEAWEYFDHLAENAQSWTPLPLKVLVRPSLLPLHLVGVCITLGKGMTYMLKFQVWPKKLKPWN
jgi:hypothetical protein